MLTRVFDSVRPLRPERLSAPWIAPTVEDPNELMCGFSRNPGSFANVNGTRSREPLRLMASDTGVGAVVPVVAVAPVVPVAPVSVPVGVPVVVFVIVPVVVSSTLLGVEAGTPGVVVVVVVVDCIENSPPVVVPIAWVVLVFAPKEPLTLLVMVRLVGMPMPSAGFCNSSGLWW